MLTLRKSLVLFLVLTSTVLSAQQDKEDQISGIVNFQKGKKAEPVVGANVYWANTSTGTTTDITGLFEIYKVTSTTKLVISFVGYENDTVMVTDQQKLTILLKSSVDLDEFNVVKRQKSTQISYLDPLKKETLGKPELQKAACCNLSESFETSPSVDVSITDAVTGTKQIQMLGLAGPNVQITRENIPDVRGISSINGLSYVPGAWIESIQLNKGTGSVVNGFESIAGQINVELLKPETSDRVFVNMYGNQGGRFEGNLALAKRFKNEKWSTGLLLHGVIHAIENDMNNDKFMDNPIGKAVVALNRWKYKGDNGLRVQIGLKGVYHEKTGGQIISKLDDNVAPWQFLNNNKRVDAWVKIGKVYEDTPWRSVGLQLAGTKEQLLTTFGKTKYDALQNSGYANAIYQSILGNTNHVIKTGASFMYDDYLETLENTDYVRTEMVPGVFGEYTYTATEKFSAVAGLRLDHNTLYGSFATPRLHVRWAPTDKIVYRMSGGRGQRTPNVMAENLGLLASNRQLIFPLIFSNRSFGALPEVAWNMGANATKTFKLDYREGSVSVDVYHTRYQNQLVVDLDANPQEISFYNLEGESYSTAVQTQLDYELIPRLDMRIAYRWNDVKTTYGSDLLQKPFVAKNRAFINFGYENKKMWKFDVTLNWQGMKRLPSTLSNPEEFRAVQESPSYVMINGQISKTWKEVFELYVGVENLTNVRQNEAIVQSENPDGKYFDSSLIWGPIFGRNIYAGLRYTMK
jgi:outer membrane receptor for ferrienterochelin and colicins